MVNKKLLQPTILSETLERLKPTEPVQTAIELPAIPLQDYDEVQKDNFTLDVSAGPNQPQRPRTPRRTRRHSKTQSSRTPRPRAHQREQEYYATDYNKPLPRTPRNYEHVKRRNFKF